MPSTYTGSDAAITDRSDVTVANPIGADARNAASVVTPLEKLANYAQRLIKKAGMLDLASTWTALQSFSVGIAGAPVYGTPLVDHTGGVLGADVHRLLLRSNVNSATAQKVRVYAKAENILEVAHNCAWNGTNWTPDTIAACSVIRFGATSHVVRYYVNGALTAFNEGAFNDVTVVGVAAGDMDLAGRMASATALVTGLLTAGSAAVTGALTAGSLSVNSGAGAVAAKTSFKAAGKLTTVSGTPAASAGAYNIASLSIGGGGNTNLVVNFTAPITNMAVSVSCGTAGFVCAWTRNSDSQVTITAYNVIGAAAVDWTAFDVTLGFHVSGD